MDKKRIEELKKKPFAKIFPEVVKNIENNFCATCGKSIPIFLKAEFRNAISIKEYRISGMCQKCQDSVFGGA